MIEAAMLEVQIKDGNSMGTNLVYSTLFGGENAGQIGSNPGNVRIPGALSQPSNPTSSLFSSTIIGKMVQVMDPNDPTKLLNVPVVSGVITAARSDADTNIIATPKILTADNEEAQIVVGETRGFPTSQLQAVNSAATTGVLNQQTNNPFQTSTQIERQDVGVTMRITPQISEGDTVRMKIFTEISNVTDPNNPFGPTTSNRQIENTVYVKDGEAVMIGGIIQDQLDTGVNKVPFLGDIPVIGWAFRSETESVVKTNLIMVLTPRIVRDPMDLQQLTVEGREKFRASAEGLEYDNDEDEERRKALEAGIDLPNDSNPVRRELSTLTNRYPTSKLPELREEKQIREEERAQKQIENASAPVGNYLVQLALVERPEDAAALLEKLMQQGYDGVVLSREENGQTLHYVQLGPYKSEADAQRVGREVKAGTGLNTYIMIEP
jgi:type II secretory pathway component GspD/PulD (secretin)